MIEAVNSVLSNAAYLKAPAEQQSVVTSYAANPDRVQVAPTVAPYISLYIKVDTKFDKAILQIRDSDTGDVVRQIPTESQLEAYRRAQSSNAVRPAKVETESAPVYTSAPEKETVVRESAPAPAPVEAAPAPAPRAETSAAPTQSAPVSVNTEA